MDGYIELSHVKKSFIGRRNRTESLIRAVDDVSLSLKKGESIGIIGTSGCGKTTILKMIMGLLKPDEGQITVKGQLGFVAQDPYSSLDPSMTIAQIVAEPLIFTGKKRSYKDCMEEVRKVLSYVHLDTEVYGQRLPSQLSGGERQRVSIARALILEPDILILDEPTSMLDQEVKESIVELIRQIAETGEFGFLMVTHDIAMSAKVCEQLLVMSEGKIVERGKTEEIMECPQSEVTRSLIAVATDVKKFWGRLS
ncbi:MAG: ABC transporter ATP-binding protein [Lachnospiraceae bacterium]|nr:ABC transporter ATP-binding protein [Lachnospiraceae bacterium]